MAKNTMNTPLMKLGAIFIVVLLWLYLTRTGTKDEVFRSVLIAAGIAISVHVALRFMKGEKDLLDFGS